MVEIKIYKNDRGQLPFDEWIRSLKDKRAVARIQVRLKRLTQGNEGDYKSVGEGVRELRVDEGKGYRVYYGWIDDAVVLLLAGGSKVRQAKDIDKAKQ
jgi:putative addiction module killer protein